MDSSGSPSGTALQECSDSVSEDPHLGNSKLVSG